MPHNLLHYQTRFQGVSSLWSGRREPGNDVATTLLYAGHIVAVLRMSNMFAFSLTST